MPQIFLSIKYSYCIHIYTTTLLDLEEVKSNIRSDLCLKISVIVKHMHTISPPATTGDWFLDPTLRDNKI